MSLDRLVRIPGRRLDWGEASYPIFVMASLVYAVYSLGLMIEFAVEQDPVALVRSANESASQLTALLKVLAPTTLTFVVAVLVWLAIPHDAPKVNGWSVAGSPSITGAEEVTDLERTRAVVASACIAIAGVTIGIAFSSFCMPGIVLVAARAWTTLTRRGSTALDDEVGSVEWLNDLDASAVAAWISLPLTLIVTMAVARYTALSPVTRYLLRHAERQRLEKDLVEAESRLAKWTGSFPSPPVKLLAGVSASSVFLAGALVVGRIFVKQAGDWIFATQFIGLSCVLLAIAVLGMRMARGRRKWMINTGIALIVVWSIVIATVSCALIVAVIGHEGGDLTATTVSMKVLGSASVLLALVVPGAIWAFPVWWWKQSLRARRQIEVDRARRAYATVRKEEQRLEDELRSLFPPTPTGSLKSRPPSLGQLMNLVRGGDSARTTWTRGTNR
ncbi:hypothetical protein [Microbacterium testaceum]|uniref:hypothetical protein n=1 Tax=Microbacterium testaceum TaxID=2033 RepID=UPI00380998F4